MPKNFNRAGRQLAAFLSVCIFLALTLAAVAVAQTVNVAPVTAATPADATTVMGWVLRALLGAGLILGGIACVWLTKFLAAQTEKTGQSTMHAAVIGIANKVWLLVQAVGSKLIAKEKPLLDKILSDGVVTAEEFNALKAAVVSDLRDQLSESLPMVKALLGNGTESGLTTVLEGLVAKFLHGYITGQIPTAPTTLPATGVPPVAAPPAGGGA
jgi:hypothetical protein